MGFHQIAATTPPAGGRGDHWSAAGHPATGATPGRGRRRSRRIHHSPVRSGSSLVLLRRCGSGAAGPVAAVIRHLVIGGGSNKEFGGSLRLMLESLDTVSPERGSVSLESTTVCNR